MADEAMEVEEAVPTAASPAAPNFPALSAIDSAGGIQIRKIPIPSHRYSPLRKHWMEIYAPIVEHLKLQIRVNTKHRRVEIRTCDETVQANALQKAADFVKAFLLGFEVKDALALLRLDDIYVDSFQIEDVKQVLHGDSLSRAIGRVAGKDGKTKFTIENTTRTRIVLADKHIHIMGSYQNIRVARDAVCALILGAPPGKVYNKLRTVAARVNERF